MNLICSFFPAPKISVYLILIILLSSLLLSTRLYASEDVNLEQEIESVFQQMLDDPSDIDVTLKYANLSIEYGDYEAAIPPLERILFFNPELNEIKLRLGVMYYNLGSFGMAREYFAESKHGDVVAPEIVEEADSYLAKIKG